MDSSYECSETDDDTDVKQRSSNILNEFPVKQRSSNILNEFPYLQKHGLIQRTKFGLSISGQTNIGKDKSAVTSRSESVPPLPIANSAVQPVQLKNVIEKAFSNSKTKSSGDEALTKDEGKNKKNNVTIATEGHPDSKDNVKETSTVSRRTSGKVKFILKGKLGHDMDRIIKSVREIMIEPVDTEASFNTEFVHGNSSTVKIKTEHNSLSAEATTHCTTSVKDEMPLSQNVSMDYVSNTTQASHEICDSVPKPELETNVTYSEPSIADIRAGFLRSTLSNDNVSKLKSTNLTSTIDEDDKVVKLEIPSDEEHVVSDTENPNSGESLQSDSWYSSSFVDNPDTPTVKKGGRSDPDNPFAMTSPSFSESAARAMMTTTQSSNATIVMVSIMSIGSRAKLIPNVVNSKAAQGGLVTVVNPVLAADTKQTQTVKDHEVNFTQTSILSKLKRETSTPKEDETLIDRLDINVRIDDEQYSGHGEQKRWLCRLCPKSYTTKHNLVAHILDHSDIKPHLCLACGKYFKQLSHLNTHMLTHDNIKPHVCPTCGKGFTQISHLKRHEAVHTGHKPNTYICDICNRGFAFPSELRIHKEKHILCSVKCKECKEEFDSSETLQEHLETSNHCENLQCKYCDRYFKFPCLLRNHMLTHEGSRPYICTECGMSFMKEHHLRSHQFTHTGVKLFSCELCTRSFNQKANLQRHMLIHNAERAYKCNVCGKTFTQPQTLKAHMVVHSDTKPYKCELCGKEFGRLHNLQGHMHMHSDSKPYSCSMCSSAFTMKGNLNRHKRIKHGLDESTELMEEDAVKFLSSMSDRGRNANLSDNDIDLDSYDELSRSKSSRKNRKSTPRKLVKKSAGIEGNNGSDDEAEQMISYSDEERENERTQIIKTNKKKTDTDKDCLLSANEIENSEVKMENLVTGELRPLRKRKKKDYGDDFVDYERDKRANKTQKYS